MIPELHNSLKRNNKITTFIGKAYLKITGWKIVGIIPKIPKMIVIIVPHTSNWDFVLTAFVSIAVDAKANFLGKHTLFKFPIIKHLMYWLGGIPVERSTRHGFVDLLTEKFKKRESLMLALSPEGTRKKVERWKTGFYYIALKAGIPILPMALDYGKKIIKFHQIFKPTGNIEKDFAYLLSLFKDVTPKNPGQFNSSQA
ncbi:MAG: acyltransferase [Chlorobi bacterium]|nr:acyltransferase [Chlorobiota bacterium]